MQVFDLLRLLSFIDAAGAHALTATAMPNDTDALRDDELPHFPPLFSSFDPSLLLGCAGVRGGGRGGGGGAGGSGGGFGDILIGGISLGGKDCLIRSCVGAWVWGWVGGWACGRVGVCGCVGVCA